MLPVKAVLVNKVDMDLSSWGSNLGKKKTISNLKRLEEGVLP